MILCDVAREDASVLVSDLRELDVDTEGSIAIEHIDSAISSVAAAAERAAEGHPGDAVVWEEVEARTSENIELNGVFLAFMALACMIASVGIFLDSPILIVGAMIVGPEFGPIAGLCVALVQRRRDVARRSLRALAIGFPVGITAAFLFALAIDVTDLTPDGLRRRRAPAHGLHLEPDAFSFIVAFLAGVAGRALADLGQVGRADRRPGLGDDDPGGREHRRRRRLRRVGRVARRDAPARPQPDRDRARRGRDALHPAAASTCAGAALTSRTRAREKAGLPLGRSRRGPRRAKKAPVVE